MIHNDYSVLMSVYVSEKPENLKFALESILNQTHKSNEIVLVEDGKLTDDLYRVIKDYEPSLKIIKLSSNLGLGNALNEGMLFCSNELIMRMDSDDYSIPTRAERMIKRFNENSNLDVLGSSINEFTESLANITSRKPAVLSDKEIKKRMKYRNPMNHPSIMFKKQSVIDAGGYKEIKYNEDYFLWIRMALNGCYFENVESPLVYMRVNSDSYQRRHGYLYYKNQKKVFKYMKTKKYINSFEYVFNIFNRLLTKVVMPPLIMKYFYLIFLRKKGEKIED